MFKGLLILILFLIGTYFCSVDLRYLTLRCRVGILACDILLYLPIFFFRPAAFFYFIFARLKVKKEKILIVNNSSDSNKQTTTRQLHLLPPGHRRRSLCQAPLRRWDSPPQAPLALTRSTSQGLGVPGRHRDPGPGASLHTSKHSHTSSTYSEAAHHWA